MSIKCIFDLIVWGGNSRCNSDTDVDWCTVRYNQTVTLSSVSWPAGNGVCYRNDTRCPYVRRCVTREYLRNCILLNGNRKPGFLICIRFVPEVVPPYWALPAAGQLSLRPIRDDVLFICERLCGLDARDVTRRTTTTTGRRQPCLSNSSTTGTATILCHPAQTVSVHSR